MANSTPTHELPCEELARRAKAGSSACFGVLVERYEARVLGFLARRCARRADAEDAMQDTFVKAWRGLARYDPSRRFSAWLFTIAAREAKERSRADHRRTARERVAASALDEHRKASTAGGETPARGAACDAPGRVWALADRVLSAEQRAALWLRCVEGMSMAEVAAALGRTEVGVRVSIFRARQRLAESLARADAERGMRDSGDAAARSPSRDHADPIRAEFKPAVRSSAPARPAGQTRMRRAAGGAA